MCLCSIVSGNISYVKKCFKNSQKVKQKRMVLFIRIAVYHWILPNKSQTKIVMSIYSMQKIENGFFNFKV